MAASEWHELTPVQNTAGYWFKRDDLFRPFDGLNVNGGKLRQCLEIVEHARPKDVITFSSIYSPQLGIVPAVCKYFQIPVRYLLGGVAETDHTQLAASLGAEIRRMPCARENYMLAAARKMAGAGTLIIKGGMGDPSGIVHQVNATAGQTRNIPPGISHIVLTCGSGLTAIGVIKGILDHKKEVKIISLVSTAPDRIAFIRNRLKSMGHHPAMIDIRNFDLYDKTGNEYKKKQSFRLGDIIFHPRYEAKTFSWIMNNVHFDKESTLFWIVGSEIL